MSDYGECVLQEESAPSAPSASAPSLQLLIAKVTGALFLAVNMARFTGGGGGSGGRGAQSLVVMHRATQL